MKANLILQELEQVADRLGWEIRYEQGDFQSGFCIKDEQRLIIIQRKSTSTERLRHIARILAQESYAGTVREQQQHWLEREVHAVPTFFFQQQYVVPGAQEAEAFVRLLHRIRSRSDRVSP